VPPRVWVENADQLVQLDDLDVSDGGV